MVILIGLWSCDPPDRVAYEETLGEVFEDVRVHQVPRHDETCDGPDNHLVYISKSPKGA